MEIWSFSDISSKYILHIIFEMVLLCFYLFDIMLYAQMLKMWILKVDKVSKRQCVCVVIVLYVVDIPNMTILGTQLWLWTQEPRPPTVQNLLFGRNCQSKEIRFEGRAVSKGERLK